jgi:hypothetical protein
MAKIIDITDKLSFEEKPKIIIKGVEIEVNDSATNFLKLASGQISDKEMVALLFSSEDQKKIEKLDLNVGDFMKLLETAANLLTGDGAGEAETPAMT